MNTSAAWWLLNKLYWPQGLTNFTALKTNLHLNRFIQTGLLILLAGMPFHAFLSVWLGSLTSQQAVIQSWKEILILVLAGATAWLIYREPTRREQLRQPWVPAAATFAGLAVLVTLLTQPSLTNVLYGLKTDFEFIVVAIIALVVATRPFMQRASLVLVAATGVVATFGAAQNLFLPVDFLTHFGYGPFTIEPYLAISGSDTYRFPATLGGPNQLGTFLILPLCICVSWLVRGHWRTGAAYVLTMGLISLFGTYSRGAWLGAGIAIVVCVILSVNQAWRRRFIFALGGVIIVSLLALPSLISHNSQAQYLLLHSSIETYDQANRSDAQHAMSIRDNVAAMARQPLGYGLGTAGPATFYTGTPNIIENQYLQIGYETGLLGLAAFLAMLGLVGRRLWRSQPNRLVPTATAAALLGISLTALVLPSWGDSSTAITVWLMVGLSAGEIRHV